jgi:hypothetical protein
MKYKIIARTKDTVPCVNKTYAYIGPGAKIGDIVEVDDCEIRIPKDGFMYKVNGSVQERFEYHYYCEIEPVTGQESKMINENEAYLTLQKNCGIKSGDRVKVVRSAKTHECGWKNTWLERMDKLVNDGKIYTVTSDNGVEGFNIGYFRIPFFCLQKVEKEPTTLRVGSNDVVITEHNLRFGCTTLSREDVEQLIAAWNKHKAS